MQAVWLQSGLQSFCSASTARQRPYEQRKHRTRSTQQCIAAFDWIVQLARQRAGRVIGKPWCRFPHLPAPHAKRGRHGTIAGAEELCQSCSKHLLAHVTVCDGDFAGCVYTERSVRTRINAAQKHRSSHRAVKASSVQHSTFRRRRLRCRALDAAGGTDAQSDDARWREAASNLRSEASRGGGRAFRETPQATCLSAKNHSQTCVHCRNQDTE